MTTSNLNLNALTIYNQHGIYQQAISQQRHAAQSIGSSLTDQLRMEVIKAQREAAYWRNLANGCNLAIERPGVTARLNAMMDDRDAALAEAAHLRAELRDATEQRDRAEAKAAAFSDDLDRLHDVIGDKLIRQAVAAPKPAPAHNPFAVKVRDPRRMGP